MGLGYEGGRAIQPTGRLSDEELWHIFSEFLPSIPYDSFVCINNLIHMLRDHVSANRVLNHKSVKKVLSRLKLPHCMSVTSVTATELYSTGGPFNVPVRGGSEVTVYAWVKGARKYSAVREHLFLIKAEHLQELILMTRKCVARRIVNMVNRAVSYTIEDILPLSSLLSGITSQCVDE